MNPAKSDILKEFEDFANRVIQLSTKQTSIKLNVIINCVGFTDAADKGLHMLANSKPAIQIKHLSLTQELAENILSSVSAD